MEDDCEDCAGYMILAWLFVWALLGALWIIDEVRDRGEAVVARTELALAQGRCK